MHCWQTWTCPLKEAWSKVWGAICAKMELENLHVPFSKLLLRFTKSSLQFSKSLQLCIKVKPQYSLCFKVNRRHDLLGSATGPCAY